MQQIIFGNSINTYLVHIHYENNINERQGNKGIHSNYFDRIASQALLSAVL
jgi:hypothetical protein